MYETVKKEKGYIDVLVASAGQGGQAMPGSVTEEQFVTTFGLNVRGTLFTVQNALPDVPGQRIPRDERVDR